MSTVMDATGNLVSKKHCFQKRKILDNSFISDTRETKRIEMWSLPSRDS